MVISRWRGKNTPTAGRRRHSPPHARFLLFADGGLTAAERRLVHWHEVEFPHGDFMRIMPERDVFGWYVHAFDIPKWLSGLDVVMDLGVIDDADETFVNGAFVVDAGRRKKRSDVHIHIRPPPFH